MNFSYMPPSFFLSRWKSNEPDFREFVFEYYASFLYRFDTVFSQIVHEPEEMTRRGIIVTDTHILIPQDFSLDSNQVLLFDQNKTNFALDVVTGCLLVAVPVDNMMECSLIQVSPEDFEKLYDMECVSDEVYQKLAQHIKTIEELMNFLEVYQL